MVSNTTLTPSAMNRDLIELLLSIAAVGCTCRSAVRARRTRSDRRLIERRGARRTRRTRARRIPGRGELL